MDKPVEIPHEGVKPAWLEGGQLICGTFQSGEIGHLGAAAWAWEQGRQFLLPADHWAAAPLRAGLTPWNPTLQGDGPPANWKMGNRLMLRSGIIMNRPYSVPDWDWHDVQTDTIGYEPSEATEPTKVIQDDREAEVTLAEAFEMGRVWQIGLVGQTLEDSRAVGRTLYSSTFKPIAEHIRAEVERQGFNSFQDADAGIAASLAIIYAAFAAHRLATTDRIAAELEEARAHAAAADQVMEQIEERFPNWRSYRDLIDCIDCTLHDLGATK